MASAPPPAETFDMKESLLVEAADKSKNGPTIFHASGQEFVVGSERFTSVLGHLPFVLPNVRDGFEVEDISKVIPPASTSSNWLCACLLCMTGVGACYLCGRVGLIREGEYGFTLNSGRPEIVYSGFYALTNPVNRLLTTKKQGEDLIQIPNYPASIVRIYQGQLGLAIDNGLPQILLPGVHVRRSNAFKFDRAVPCDEEVISFGPIKILIVKSGTVRVCYHRGKVQIFPEGRYAINDGTFVISAKPISTTQQNVRFKQHIVLLDGGISLLVEGLLTYQVKDVEKLIRELGDGDLLRVIQDVTKAEISRVFAAVHLEQISSAQAVDQEDLVGGHIVALPGESTSTSSLTWTSSSTGSSSVGPASSYLGAAKDAANVGSVRDEGEGASRSRICDQVIQFVTPMAATWGVKIINFQLESTKIADNQYARDYEVASLSMAKAKANLRSVQAENEIVLQRARAAAESVRIAAYGDAAAVVTEAKARAAARKIDAEARNNAALSMKNPFAKQYAFASQQVEFAQSLKATNLTVLPNSAIGRPLAAQLSEGKNALSQIH